jgi:hypothetical protein
MTKIGEGNQPPKVPTEEQYRKDLDTSAAKFLNALESYDITGDTEQKSQLKAIMDQQLALIRASVSELKNKGIYNQENKVENDYKQYMSDGSPDSLSALEQDLGTLRDYNSAG